MNYTMRAGSSLACKLCAFIDWVKMQVPHMSEVHGDKADREDQSTKLNTAQHQLSV